MQQMVVVCLNELRSKSNLQTKKQVNIGIEHDRAQFIVFFFTLVMQNESPMLDDDHYYKNNTT
jgi:hypothetical protein